MTLAPPLPQHLQALERANTVRFARADLKRRIASAGSMSAGLAAAADVVEFPPSAAEGMTVYDLLDAAPRVGRELAIRRLKAMRLSETKQLGDLTARQRTLAAAVLRGGS